MIVRNKSDIQFSMIVNNFEDKILMDQVGKFSNEEMLNYFIEKATFIGRSDIVNFLKSYLSTK